MGFTKFEKRGCGGGNTLQGHRIRLNKGRSFTLSTGLVVDLKKTLCTHLEVYSDRDTRQVALVPIRQGEPNAGAYQVHYSKKVEIGNAHITPTAFMTQLFELNGERPVVDASWDAHGRIVFSVPSRMWR